MHPAGWLDRRGLLGLALGLAALPRPSLAAVTAARVEAAGAGAVLTLALPPGSRWRLTARRNPDRLVLDLPGMAWRAPARLAGAGPVRAARRVGDALVLDLARPVTIGSAQATGGQLRIQVAPGPAAAFAKAEGRVLAEGGAPVAPRPLVVLDPGHGGVDPGAIGRAGTEEKRIVLAAALELKRVLEAGGRCRVAMTRTRDVFVPLGDRVEFARKRDAALFVSVHADSAPGARGASVYTLAETATDGFSAALAQRENGADRRGGLRMPSVPPEVQRILISLMRAETRAGSARLARLTVEELGERVPLLPNTHRQAGFVVLKAPEIPSVLVELGFLSHPGDEAALRRPDHRARLAQGLAQAVEGWLSQAAERPMLAGGQG
ncbi:MAG TPA: N-acetylmuramoyl-L-alanine amidase [Acetobacteraceae bacterium]|nr:N-acetylmuramoyl-L-alanine amidase [Acetobacteraceae bacterium]